MQVHTFATLKGNSAQQFALSLFELSSTHPSVLTAYPTTDCSLFRLAALPKTAEEGAWLNLLMQQVYEDYIRSRPSLRSLPLIIRLNALDAIADNAEKMGISHFGLCREDLISPFTPFGPRQPVELNQPCREYPLSLQPTEHQRCIPHHPWIDLLPYAGMRDSILYYLRAGLMDDAELCADILGVGDDDWSTRPAMIVWGDASDWKSWEVNTMFLMKWGFLIRGCPQALEATNLWRSRRGDKPIVFEC